MLPLEGNVVLMFMILLCRTSCICVQVVANYSFLFNRVSNLGLDNSSDFSRFITEAFKERSFRKILKKGKLWKRK